jgi:hypothetical protein
MVCFTLSLLFLMSAILLMCGLHFLYPGTAGGEQITHASRLGFDGNNVLRNYSKCRPHAPQSPGLH